jgi:hypothetical protein
VPLRGSIATAIVGDVDLARTRKAVWRARCSSSPRERRVLREDLTVGPVADARPGDAAGRLADDPQLEAFSNGVNGDSGPARRTGRALRDGTTSHRSCRRGRLDVQTLGQGVDDGGADAVQTAGCRVGAAAELAAGVQLREDDLDAREPGARLDVDRDAARAVADLDAAVGVQDDVDSRRSRRGLRRPSCR